MSVSAPQAPLDGVASLEEEVTPVLPGSRDEMATRDCQAPRGKRAYQETLAPGETKGKKELLGLRGPLDPLGPGALLVILEKMAPREHKAQRVPKERLEKMARWAQREPRGPRGMMGVQASQGSLDPQGPRASRAAWALEERMVWMVPQAQRGRPASKAPMEPQGHGVPRASRESEETPW